MTPYKTKNRKHFFAFIILLLLTSCSANIESTSANSISAILAVCGEYILAGFSLIILLLIHCMRITGVVISVISVYLLYNDIKIGQLDSILLLLVGLILVGISFLPPVKYHEPNVFIAKNVVKPKNIELKNDSASAISSASVFLSSAFIRFLILASVTLPSGKLSSSR